MYYKHVLTIYSNNKVILNIFIDYNSITFDFLLTKSAKKIKFSEMYPRMDIFNTYDFIYDHIYNYLNTYTENYIFFSSYPIILMMMLKLFIFLKR